jgi:predicted Zn-ribbon and HTH transcriptional regulator
VTVVIDQRQRLVRHPASCPRCRSGALSPPRHRGVSVPGR